MTDKKTLLLVDGSSYLYRAFFAGGGDMSITLADGTVQNRRDPHHHQHDE